MAEVGLHRAETAPGSAFRVLPGSSSGEGFPQPCQLDRVTHRGPRPVRLDVGDGAGRNPGPLVHLGDQRRLRTGVRHGEGSDPPSVIDTGTPDDTEDAIAVSFGAAQPLEQDGHRPLTADIPVRAGSEGVTAGARREEPAVLERREEVLREEDVHAPRDRRVAVPGLQASHCPVDGRQRTRARGVDGLTGPVEVQQEGDAVGQHRVGAAGRGVGIVASPGLRDQGVILCGGNTDEHPRPRTAEGGQRVPGVLDAARRHLEEEAVLGVHELGLQRADAEVPGIEGIDVVDEPTASGRPPLPQVAPGPVRRGGPTRHEIGSLQEPPPESVDIGCSRKHACHAHDGDRFPTARVSRTVLRGRSRAGPRLRGHEPVSGSGCPLPTGPRVDLLGAKLAQAIR